MLSLPTPPTALARAPPLITPDFSLRLLGVDLTSDGGERYIVETDGGGRRWSAATLHQPSNSGPASADEWLLSSPDASSAPINVRLGTPDELFALALGDAADDVSRADVDEAAPHWPEALRAQLSRRRMCGAGTIAFDAEWFIRRAATSSFERPMLLPRAAAKVPRGPAIALRLR